VIDYSGNISDEGSDTTTAAYARQLEQSSVLREPVMRSAIRWLDLPQGSYGIDVGCGVGSVTLLLAQDIGSEGRVLGLDQEPAFLKRARQRAGQCRGEASLTFQVGSAERLPFADATFDWAWSSDCVGYAPGAPDPLLKEIARVVKPGGRVALAAWSSQQLLPGYPLLEARLNATGAGVAPFTTHMQPGQHFLRALGWLQTANLKASRAHTVLGEIQAPLSAEMRTSLMSLFKMRWGAAETEVPAADWDEFQRLCDPGSSNFILDIADYYAFFTYSLFCGQVP